MLLYQILALTTLEKNIGTKIMNSKISAPTWNEEFELPDGSSSVSDIQDYFKYIIKNETVSDIPSLRIYLNKIEKRNTLKLKQDIILNF